MLLAVEHGDQRVQGDLRPTRADHQHLDRVTDTDDADESHDGVFELAETPEFESEDGEDANRGEYSGNQQDLGLVPSIEKKPRTEEKVEAKRGAEKLRHVGGESGDLSGYPQKNGYGL